MIQRSELFVSSWGTHLYKLLDDDRSVEVTIHRYMDWRAGWVFVDRYIIGSFVGPMKYLGIYFRQLYETLPGWRGYSWDKGEKWRTWFYEQV